MKFFPRALGLQEDLWSKLMIAPLFNNSIHGDVMMRRDWIETCLKYAGANDVKNVIDLVSAEHGALGIVQNVTSVGTHKSEWTRSWMLEKTCPCKNAAGARAPHGSVPPPAPGYQDPLVPWFSRRKGVF